MRRTSTREVQMTTLHIHPHAAFDRFPMLVESVNAAFGTDGLMSNVERFIEAESADFHWDGRLAEMNLGAFGSFDDRTEAPLRGERVCMRGLIWWEAITSK